MYSQLLVSTWISYFQPYLGWLSNWQAYFQDGATNCQPASVCVCADMNVQTILMEVAFPVNDEAKSWLMDMGPWSITIPLVVSAPMINTPVVRPVMANYLLCSIVQHEQQSRHYATTGHNTTILEYNQQWTLQTMMNPDPPARLLSLLAPLLSLKWLLDLKSDYHDQVITVSWSLLADNSY